MERPLYVIQGWNEYFENSESRKLKRASYVCVPNKHDGKSYRRVTRVKDAPLVYCAWQLMLQLASKMPVRGVLADHDGPLDAEDMADKTGFPVLCFERALNVLVDPKIGWLKRVLATEIDHFREETARHRENLPTSPDTSRRSATTSRHLPTSPDTSRSPDPTPDAESNRVAPGESPDAPGDSPGISRIPPTLREMSGDVGPRGRARENRREGNGREVPPYAPQGACDGLGREEVLERLAPLFNLSAARALSQAAEYSLNQLLPLPAEEVDAVVWLYQQPEDSRVAELRGKPTKLKTLFEGWQDVVGVARRLAKKEGAAFGVEKKEAAPEPDGWRERLLAEYPEAELPDRFEELTASMKKIARGAMAPAEVAA